jgi:hypothetical protein
VSNDDSSRIALKTHSGGRNLFARTQTDSAADPTAADYHAPYADASEQAQDRARDEARGLRILVNLRSL